MEILEIWVMRMIEDHTSSMSEQHEPHVPTISQGTFFATCQDFLVVDVWGVYCYFLHAVASEFQRTSIISSWFKSAF